MPSSIFTVTLTLLNFLASVTAQQEPSASDSPGMFPECATTCLSQAAYISGCILADNDCVCRNWVPIDTMVIACLNISNPCTTDEMFRVAQLEEKICALLGYGTWSGTDAFSVYPTAIDSTDVATASGGDYGTETLITASSLPTTSSGVTGRSTSTRTITATASFSGTKTISTGTRTGGALTAIDTPRASNAAGKLGGGVGLGAVMLLGLAL